MGSKQTPRAVMCYEDRKSHETGIKLLILSFTSYHSDIDFYAFVPNASEKFLKWCAGRDVKCIQESPSKQSGFNIKPDLLLWGLDKGYERVTFIDADIILTRALPKFFMDPAEDAIIASQTAPLNKVRTKVRTDFWGFKQGRRFIRDPSGCFLSASKKHRSLLNSWAKLLTDERYLSAKNLQDEKTLIPVRGDDEVLSALLGSEQYAHLKLVFLNSTSQIAQCGTPGSYTVHSRLRSLLGHKPYLIHAVGNKPWLREEPYYKHPYSIEARAYANQLDEECNWSIKASHQRDKLWSRVYYNNSAMCDLPAALADETSRLGLRSFLNNIIYFIRELFKF